MKGYALGLFLFLFVLGLPDAALAAGKRTPAFFRIPVYFITDRNRVPSNGDQDVHFGNQRKYPGLCRHDPYLGVAYCRIKNTEHKEFTPAMEALGWTISKRRGEGPDGDSLVEGKDPQEKKTKFYAQVYEQSKLPVDHEVFMFVPGYMSTFESGLRSCARLGYYGERPVVLYSWASKGKFTEYFADESTSEWSQDHFNEVLSEFAGMAEKQPPLRARLYAHSMGGRLVLRATPLLKKNKAFIEISVVCPDVDDGVVKHYAQKYFDGSGTQLVRLYLSNRDYMLRMSKFVHGGYGRLGEDKQPLDNLLPKDAPKFAKEVGFNEVDQKQPPAESSAGCDARLSRRMLTIDFTAVDIGTVGHRIPVELLCSLSQKGEPGPGLGLCMVHPRVDKDDPKPLPGDGIVRVVKTQRWHHIPIAGTLIDYRPRIQLLFTKDWSLK